MKHFFYNLIIIFFIFFSCKKEEKDLKLIKVSEFSSIKVSDTSLVNFIKTKTGISLRLDFTLSEDEAISKLERKEADLVILPNNYRNPVSNLRVIVPLLPRMLIILTNKRVDSLSVKELFETGEIYFEDRSRLDSLLFDKMYINFDVDAGKINSFRAKDIGSRPSDALKVYVGFTHVKNRMVLNLTNSGWNFYSLGHIDNYKKGSRVEGFTMMNSSAYPYIIPMSAYRGQPHKPILTFAINDMLICREDLDEQIVYELAKMIIENKAKLIDLNDIYNLLNFDYKAQLLAFPIHTGAQKYLDRDEPPIWYKYVNMAWPLISISVIVFGMIASFREKMKRRKKHNIERYYNHLLEIRDKAETAKDLTDFIKLLKELKTLRSEAMNSLATKKLDPGESFNIFLALYSEIRGDIAETIKELRIQEKKSTNIPNVKTKK